MAGQTIYRQGAEGESMYLIDEGQVQVAGATGLIATLGAGDEFGEGAFLTGEPRSTTATALTDVDRVVVRPRRLRATGAALPDAGAQPEPHGLPAGCASATCGRCGWSPRLLPSAGCARPSTAARRRLAR